MVFDKIDVKSMLDPLRDSEIGAALLDEVIPSQEKLLQEMEDLEKNTKLNPMQKAGKKMLIEIQGRILFGDERKSAIVDENPEDEKDTEQQTKTDNSPRENNEYAGDAYDKTMVKLVRNELKNVGITNRFIQRAILATIAKESAFKPDIAEISYKNTSNSKIRQIFGARVAGLSDDALNTLKADEEAFRDRVYGPDDPTGTSQKYGNTKKGDGMKYRGRGFNGVTFKNTYKKYGDMIGVDLVKYPEKLGEPEIAAKVNAMYFAQGLQNNIVINNYGNKKGPNDFKNFETALKAAIHINAGLGKDFNSNNIQINYDRARTRAKHFEEVDRA